MNRTFLRPVLAVFLAGGLVATLTATTAVAASKKPVSSFKVAGHPVKFSSSISDYVLYDCAGKSVKLSFTGVGKSDRVNGKPLKVDRQGRATLTKQFAVDELLTVRLAQYKRSFYVRCLPDDFPRLTLDIVDAAATPRGYYMIPYYSRSLQGQNFSSMYYIITDWRGTPLWYQRASGGVTVLNTDGKGRLLTQGVLNGMSPGAAHADNSLKIIGFDGSVIADLKPSDPLIRPVELLANGNLLMISAPRRSGVDFTKSTMKFKDNSNGVCTLDRGNVTMQGLRITEMTTTGEAVWDKDITDLFDVNEPSQASVVNVARPGDTPDCVLDLLHPNHVSAAGNGSGYVVSLRWAGVYHVDRSGTSITWKVGGSATPASLTIQSDPLGSTGPLAQHGGYLTEDNRLLIFDNQLQRHILPRAVEYYIDPAAGTAVHLKSFNLDANFCVTSDGSLLCPSSSQGNASYLPDGNILVSWGNTDGRDEQATVFDHTGAEIATLRTSSAKPNVFSVYYAEPEMLNMTQLRSNASSTKIISNGTHP
jgi:hypothetical protein